jgi:hypothetical protein
VAHAGPSANDCPNAVLGLRELSRRDLERKAGRRIHVWGLVRIASDVRLRLHGHDRVGEIWALHASPAVKGALADRII